jgi:hypothetical protein
MSERRRAVRQKSFLRGNIQFNSGRNSVDCLIRDITVYGARLVCSDAVSTPDVIDVFIPQKDQTFRSHVIWRHGQDMGIPSPRRRCSARPKTPPRISISRPESSGSRTSSQP